MQRPSPMKPVLNRTQVTIPPSSHVSHPGAQHQMIRTPHPQPMPMSHTGYPSPSPPMQNRGLNRAQQQEVRYRSSPNLPIAQQQPASNSVGRVRHSSVEGMPKGAGRGGSVQGPRLGIVAEEEVGRAPRGPSPQRPASAQPQKGNQAPTESRLQYLESELASFTSKMTEMRTAAEALQEEVRVVRPSLDGTGKAPSSAATSIGPPHNGGSDEMDSEATGTWVLDALKKVLADRERHGTEFGSPNIGTSNTSNTSNAPDDSTLQELRALRQEVRLEAEARKQLSLKMEAMFLDEKKKRDEVIRQAVMQREEQDSKIEQRWQGQLKEESSLRRAVESHLEARLVALQREARLEAGNATSQAQQAVGEFVQMRERLQQEMNAQKQEIGRASADLSRLIDEVRNHGGALKADMGMPSAEITENLVRAEVRRQLAERPAETDMATSLELQALSTRFERLEQTLANEATTRQEESSKSISMLQELTSELGKSQMQALREFEETFKTKLNAAMSEAQAAQQTCVEERQLRRQQLAKETKDREEICMGILRTMEERIVSESQKLQKLLSDQKLSFEQLLRGHDRELQSTMEMSVANFVEKHSQDVVSTRHDLLELREELQEAVRSKRFDQPSVTSQGEVQRLVDGQTKLWATLDQVRQDLSEEIQRKDLATRTGPASDVLRALLHYLYTSCLPADISDETAKELQKLSQLNGKDIGHLSKLCTEYLEATAVKNRIKSLLSDLYSILEYILQISESLASGFRHDRTSNGTVNTGNGCRVDPLKIVKVTKMSLRQLSIGMLKFVLLCDIFTKHKSDLSREERQDIIQHCWKRLPCFVELVEKFLTVFQGALSGLSESEREDMALHLIPEIEKIWLTSTQLGSDANCALETITRKVDKDHKSKTHLPKMATSLSRTLRNAVHLREVITLKRFHDKVSSSLMFLLQKRGDFTSLSEEQKLRSVLKTMDNMMLEIPDHIRTLHKFPRIFEKKMPWKQWKYLCKEWTSFVSLSLRKVLANKDILEPVVEQTIALIHEDQFTNLVQELGFRKESFSEDKDEDITREKKSRGRVESVITCPPADKSPLAQSVNQLLISGAHADMKFIFDKTDLSHYSACTECKRICDQNVMEIAAHRVIVATRCDWFRRALLSGMKESIERRILIPDTSPCLFYKFLGYLYSGILDKDSLSLDELAEVIALSDKYEVDSLKEICEGVLLRNIDGDNVLLYLGMAEQYSVARLKEESFNYITLHPEVLESEMFEELPDTLKQSIEDRIRQNMPQAKPITEEVNQALAITRLEDFEGLLEDDFVEYSEDSDDDNDDDVMPRGNSQIERCIEQLRDVLGDDVPRRELVRVTLAADCDPNRALNFYFT